MQVISLMTQKGGSGKTTLAINLCGELHTRGYRVALIDSDLQGSALAWTEEEALPFQVIEGVVEDKKDSLKNESFLKANKNNYDFIVIDNAPSMSIGMATSMKVSNLILIPTKPSFMDIKQAYATHEVIKEFKGKKKEPIIMFVPNMVRGGTKYSKEIQKVLKEEKELVAPNINDRMAFVQSQEGGKWIGDFKKKSDAYEEIKKFTDAVLKALNIKSKRSKK